MNTRPLRMLAVVLGSSLLLSGLPVARAQHPPQEPDPPGGQTLSMAKFYAGPLERMGTFPGKLVCLRCDLAHSTQRAEQCQKEGHVHALSMDDGSMIHPLLAGTEEALKQINSPQLHGKKVKVDGKHYVMTGAILVSRITVVK